MSKVRKTNIEQSGIAVQRQPNRYRLRPKDRVRLSSKLENLVWLITGTDLALERVGVEQNIVRFDVYVVLAIELFTLEVKLTDRCG